MSLSNSVHMPALPPPIVGHALADLPVEILRIRDAANDPGKSVSDIVKLVQADDVIAAYCL